MCKIIGTPTQETWPDWDAHVKLQLLPQYPQKQVVIEGMSPEAVDLLNRMLSMNPSDRITAKEALEHDFFK